MGGNSANVVPLHPLVYWVISDCSVVENLLDVFIHMMQWVRWRMVAKLIHQVAKLPNVLGE